MQIVADFSASRIDDEEVYDRTINCQAAIIGRVGPISAYPYQARRERDNREQCSSELDTFDNERTSVEKRVRFFQYRRDGRNRMSLSNSYWSLSECSYGWRISSKSGTLA